jgi:NitT/TauT family transport system substrate-binding protein
MRYADYGLVTYGNALMTTDGTIRDRPQLVSRFLAATLRGLADAFDRPREAAEVLHKHNREVAPDFSREELLAIRELAWSDEARVHGLGHMSADRMTSTRDVVTEALGLKRVVPIDELYTVRFLPGR